MTPSTVHYAVAGWLLSLRPSGATRRLESLLHALPARLQPHESVTVLVGCGQEHGLAADAGLATHPLDVAARPTWRRVLGERRHLTRTLTTLGADLLHLESLPVPPLPATCALSWHVHDLRDLGPHRRRPRLLARQALHRALRRADVVCTPSRAVADALPAAAAPALDAHVVPAPLSPRELRTLEAAAEHGVADARPASDAPWLHVGHLEPRKNLGVLLNAWARARDRLHPASPPPLCFVGRDAGSGADLRHRAHALGVDARFAGPVDDDTLDRFYASCRGVLIPSLEEGFGLPLSRRWPSASR